MAIAEAAMNPKAWMKSANLYSRWSLPWARVQCGSWVRADSRSAAWSFCGAGMHLSYCGGKAVVGCWLSVVGCRLLVAAFRLRAHGRTLLDRYSFGCGGCVCGSC